MVQDKCCRGKVPCVWLRFCDGWVWGYAWHKWKTVVFFGGWMFRIICVHSCLTYDSIFLWKIVCQCQSAFLSLLEEKLDKVCSWMTFQSYRCCFILDQFVPCFRQYVMVVSHSLSVERATSFFMISSHNTSVCCVMVRLFALSVDEVWFLCGEDFFLNVFQGRFYKIYLFSFVLFCFLLQLGCILQGMGWS